MPSEHMVFERINASGLGLTIGSIGDGIVRNVTFRHCYLYNTVKGLYMKFRRSGGNTGEASPTPTPNPYANPPPPPPLPLPLTITLTPTPNPSATPKAGRVSDVLFEDITIEGATQWAIWIGPAQQARLRDRGRVRVSAGLSHPN